MPGAIRPIQNPNLRHATPPCGPSHTASYSYQYQRAHTDLLTADADASDPYKSRESAFDDGTRITLISTRGKGGFLGVRVRHNTGNITQNPKVIVWGGIRTPTRIPPDDPSGYTSGAPDGEEWVELYDRANNVHELEFTSNVIESTDFSLTEEILVDLTGVDYIFIVCTQALQGDGAPDVPFAQAEVRIISTS